MKNNFFSQKIHEKHIFWQQIYKKNKLRIEFIGECAVSEYTEWSPCSVTCGKGIRTRIRQYLNENLAKSSNCNRQLISKEMCAARVPECK